MKIAVANPTSLNGNQGKFASIPFDLCLVSETSATALMQNSISRAFRKETMQVNFGHPVPSRRQCRDMTMSMRGMALGVALISRQPMCARPSRDKLPGHWDETCRVMVSMVHTSRGPLKVVTLYGVLHNAEDAHRKNVTLWHAILSMVCHDDLPTLIGGDANLRVQDLEVWRHFSDMGYTETFEAYANKFGDELPPTCNNATRHDILIFSKHLAPLFDSAQVVREGLFPRHDPLVVDFAMRQNAYVQRALPSPEPLHNECLSDSLFSHLQEQYVNRLVPQHAFDNSCDVASCHAHVTSTLRKVGDVFERAYDNSIHRHNIFSGNLQPWPVRRNRRTKRCHISNLEAKKPKQTVKY